MNATPALTAFALLWTLALPALASAAAEPPNTADTTPKTFRMATIGALREAPNGRIVDIWDADIRFTSSQHDEEWVRVTGHFPGSRWEPLRQSLWVHRNYVSAFEPKAGAPRSTRPDGISRYIEIDKESFELQVIEQRGEQREVLLTTVVALGMDSCMPKERGGRCYYTEAGEYAVRWKVHDPKGIEWCIPKFMENEYKEDIARGQRCFRGAIGTHALNIGKSYAIHGTSNPASLGSRASRGCVRAENSQMEQIYRLMEVGDKVYIRE